MELNETVINHTKDNMYEALTGRSDDYIIKDVVLGLDEFSELSNDPNSGKNSFLLHALMAHPKLSDVQKVYIAYRIGELQGAAEGAKSICNSCAIGPASQYLHRLLKEKE